MLRQVLARNFSQQKEAPKRQSTFMRVWVWGSTAAWPIIGITGAAALFAAYKIYQTLSGPDYHFDKHHRGTIDYIENDRDPKAAEQWANSAFHRGPEFIRKNLIVNPSLENDKKEAEKKKD